MKQKKRSGGYKRLGGVFGVPVCRNQRQKGIGLPELKYAVARIWRPEIVPRVKQIQYENSVESHEIS